MSLGHSLDTTYVLSGWAKADAVPDNVTEASEEAQDTVKQFGLRAVITYSDGHKEYHYVPFEPDISDWQFTSMAIVPEYQPTAANVTIASVDVVCAYEGNANAAYFDDLSLVCASAQSYTYDENGMPTFSESTGLNGQTVNYDGHNNISSVTVTGEDGTDIEYTYTYDSTFVHRLKTSSNGIITQSLSHDTVGNVTKTTLKSATDSSAKVISTSSTYTNGGNLVSSVTDAAGNKTTYGYGDITVSGIAASCDTTSAFYKTFGMPSTITDAKGTTTSYVTDTFARIRQINLEELASIKYTYGKDLLYELQRTASGKSQTYHFFYDGFGNTTSIGIGSRSASDRMTLVSYEYGSGTVDNGLLTKQTYGNGDAVSFTYDNLGRNKTTTYSDGRVLTYIYTGDGQLYSVHDSKTGYTYQYTYDSIGRLIASSVKNSSNTVLMQTRQEYNANNQLVGQYWTVGTTTYSEVYTYSKTDGSVLTMKTGSGQTLYMSYDKLRRLTGISGAITNRSYTYLDISDTQTTTMVSQLDYSKLAVPLSFTYEYDELGNITRIGDPISGTKTYTYDAQGQMLSETIGETTYTYTYDNAGNILTANGKTYTYGHAVWKDLLTAYDGESITYDGSGNPLSYYNGKRYTFTWEEGRNLVSATEGTNTYTYAYDSNGLRVSKTVNGIKHEYLYASGRLLRETIYDASGSVTDVLDFAYDWNGQPFSVKYNGATYFYVLNLQGDVVRIVDGGGTSYGVYRYDAWGNILYSTNNTLMNINPLRYRGYYYDTETGFYYLQSRYYDPVVCRYLNPDVVFDYDVDIPGYNLYVYCGNRPVFRIDVSGKDSDGIEDCDEIDDYEAKVQGGGGGNSSSPANPSQPAPSPASSSASPAAAQTGQAAVDGSGYKVPPGGGGVSSSISVGDTTVTFGHGGRHLEGTNLTTNQVETQIAYDVVLKNQAGFYKGSVNVGGNIFTYTSFRLTATLINVGTYY